MPSHHKRIREIARYTQDLQAALITERHPVGRLMLTASVGVVALFIAWAALSEVEEITKASGMVIPSGREQIIESLDAGVLAELYVHEGDVVSQGQPLLRIDDTRSGALHREIVNKNLALKAIKARLQAELAGSPPVFPAEVRAVPELMNRELAAYAYRLKSLQVSVADLERTKVLLSNELTITEPLAQKGVVSVVEVLRLKRQRNEVQQQINERKNKLAVEVSHELAKVASELAQSDEAANARQDTLKRAIISSPVRGIVKNMHLTTVGGVIQSGQSLMEIVPIGGDLLIEGFVKPADVAFLKPGLTATVKCTAYDYTSYGALKGELVHVSPDTLRHEPRGHRETGKPDEGHYRILVKTNADALVRGNNILPIIPGMTTTVEIKTGTKKILDYLLKPVLRAQEAFRER